ncbi:MAG: hypothetical protein LBJ98_02380 [Endomicrobium sp.]|jgi:transposase|nr:hypothetical protein [Endomicrobium sp.]
MGYIYIYYKIAAKRAIKGLERERVESEKSQETKYRKSVIEHYEEYGLGSRLDAYKISRATLYNWQKKYLEIGIYGLIKGLRSPKKKRCSKVPLEVKEYICKYRDQHKGVRKECIKPELDRFCCENGFKGI